MNYEQVKNVGIKFWDTLVNSAQKKKEEKLEAEKSAEILALIADAKENLDVARNNFNFATDDRLLEYRIYELKAAESRLGYFIKMAKDKNISSNIFAIKQSEEGSACL